MTSTQTFSITTHVGTIGFLQEHLCQRLGPDPLGDGGTVVPIVLDSLPVDWNAGSWDGEPPVLHHFPLPEVASIYVLAALCPTACLYLVVDLADTEGSEALAAMCAEQGTSILSLGKDGELYMSCFDVPAKLALEIRRRANSIRSGQACRRFTTLPSHLPTLLARAYTKAYDDVPVSANHVVVHLLGDRHLRDEAVAAALLL